MTVSIYPTEFSAFYSGIPICPGRFFALTTSKIISIMTQHKNVITETDGTKGVCVDPGEMGAILEARPARRGKGQTVGIRQWRRIDSSKCLRT